MMSWVGLLVIKLLIVVVLVCLWMSRCFVGSIFMVLM